MGISEKIGNVLRSPFESLLYYYMKAYNHMTDISRDGRNFRKTGMRETDEIIERSKKRTDISDHLMFMFGSALSASPKLIVELGVRTGESTFVFERVAKLTGAQLVSVDIADCEKVSPWKKWHFVKSDDIKFAREFRKWCAGKKIKPVIDVLFIDTSHEHDHTVAEIKSWLPFLSSKGIIFFHDTNVQRIYKRRDGSLGSTGTPRGATTALKEFLKYDFNETVDFEMVKDGFCVEHHSNCCGITLLKKL